MRIVTKIIAVIATTIVLVGVGWSIYVYNSPLESEFPLVLDDLNVSQKLIFTGNLTVINETMGNLTLNETGIIVSVLFEGYNETNVTEFHNKTIEILGRLYQVCDCDYFEGPCIKDIETIEIVDE